MTSKPLTHLLIAFALLAAAVAGYLVWYFRVEAASERAALLSADIADKGVQLERIRSASLALSKLTEDERAVTSYFVNEGDVVSFLEYLEGAGDAFGAVVEVVSVASEPGTPRGRLLVSVRIEGSFQAVARTLGTIEYGPYDMRMGNATVDTAGDLWMAATVLTVGTKAGISPATP